MLTIERTDEYILLKVPSSTTEAQLQALVKKYQEIQSIELPPDYANGPLPYVGDDEYDPEVGREAVALGRMAKKGSWKRVASQLVNHPEYDSLLKSIKEEE